MINISRRHFNLSLIHLIQSKKIYHNFVLFQICHEATGSKSYFITSDGGINEIGITDAVCVMADGQKHMRLIKTNWNKSHWDFNLPVMII